MTSRQQMIRRHTFTIHHSVCCWRASLGGSVSRKDDPGQWALIRVWDGATLARFDNELTARSAMAGLDDDEVVLLAVDATRLSDGRFQPKTLARVPTEQRQREETAARPLKAQC
jgi:hypothetical protein